MEKVNSTPYYVKYTLGGKNDYFANEYGNKIKPEERNEIFRKNNYPPIRLPTTEATISKIPRINQQEKTSLEIRHAQQTRWRRSNICRWRYTSSKHKWGTGNIIHQLHSYSLTAQTRKLKIQWAKVRLLTNLKIK